MNAQLPFNHEGVASKINDANPIGKRIPRYDPMALE